MARLLALGLAGAALALPTTAPPPKQHTLELLESLAESPLRGLSMRDAAGRSYDCRAGDAVAPADEDAPPESLAEALGLLRGVCAYLNQGWWTYEWCHRRHVRQFHLEARQRDPDWSLGDFGRTEVDAEGDGIVDAALLGPEQLGRARDVFDVGGQRCDETGAGRSARVRFRCCDGARAERKHRAQTGSGPAAFITSVDEVELCTYDVAVCSPALCAAATPNATAALLLKALEGVCLQRHEGWWSFEFCYKKGARQFHVEGMALGLPQGLAPNTNTIAQVETVDNADGRKQAKVAAEFSLGGFAAGADADDDATLVVPEGLDGWDKARVEVEYADGTPCDVDVDGDGIERRRAVTARLVCGETNALTSVVEDRTCHYVFTVTTPELCGHPAFAVAPATRPMTCVPEDGAPRPPP